MVLWLVQIRTTIESKGSGFRTATIVGSLLETFEHLHAIQLQS
jgi:hypothetical protein